MNTGNHTWEQAVLRVLEEAGEPMHYRDVADIVVQQRLTRSVGATPHQQANSALRRLLGEDVIAESEGKGMYVLPAVAERLNAESRQIEQETEVFDRIASYGLYWEKDKVNWSPGQGGRIRLLGRAKGTTIDVNFSSQQGIYVLHRGMDVAYVGQTSGDTQPHPLFRRLRWHYEDLSKEPLWDRFSWFGFRRVQESGELAELEETTSTRTLIKVVETVLIQSCRPRLNDQSGELLGTVFRQVPDPDLPVG